jgi:virginiamycin B lyase
VKLRTLSLLFACGLAFGAESDRPAMPSVKPGAKGAAKTAVPVPPKNGLKTPGVQVPFASLKEEATLPVEGPVKILTGDTVTVPSRGKDSLVVVDSKTNKAKDPIAGMNKPCSGIATGFTSTWIPNCGSQSLVRMETKTSKITATIPSGIADVHSGLATTADSVWLFTDNKGTLSRIDPDTNTVVGEIRLEADCANLISAESSLWVSCASENKLVRISPLKLVVEKRIDVSANPHAIAFGDGSLWVLCEKDGKIDRIDPKTNKVIKSIELGTAGLSGEMAYGESFLWVSQPGFPITRIETTSEKERVAQQFWGEGGGLITTAQGAVWMGSPAKNTVARYDPKRIIATLAE